MCKEELLIKIEELRNKMVTVGMSSSFKDEKVIRLSEQLDRLLIRYQHLYESISPSTQYS